MAELYDKRGRVRGMGEKIDVRDCENCKNYVAWDDRPDLKSCRKWECDYEPLLRHGRWEAETITDVYGLKHDCYVCSVCGAANGDDGFDFCPNCGAKMDGGDGDD